MSLRLYGNGNIENVDSIVTSASATLSSTELGYLDGINSDIQTQIDNKAETESPSFTGDVVIPGMPYKMAAGYVSAVSSSGTSVTFPAGRFDVPPRLAFGPGYISGNGGTGDAVVWQYASVSSTGVTLVSSDASSYECHWIAVQMTSTSANG